jgi:hypothetical protein
MGEDFTLNGVVKVVWRISFVHAPFGNKNRVWNHWDCPSSGLGEAYLRSLHVCVCPFSGSWPHNRMSWGKAMSAPCQRETELRQRGPSFSCTKIVHTHTHTIKTPHARTHMLKSSYTYTQRCKAFPSLSRHITILSQSELEDRMQSITSNSLASQEQTIQDERFRSH